MNANFIFLLRFSRLPSLPSSLEDFKQALRLPEGLDAIESRTFYNCTALKEISIPNSVTRIGGDRFGNYYGCPDGIFMNCTSLERVMLPSNLAVLPMNAFRNCSSMINLDFLPNSIAEIPSSAFEGCSRLSSIVFPDNLTSIGDAAFRNCSGLENLEIPDSVEHIGSQAFLGCHNLERVLLPNSTTSIERYSFEDCEKLTSAGPVGEGYNFEIGWTTEIPAGAFSGCNSLTTVKIPSEIITISSNAFADCGSLSNVIIPESVVNIGDFAFAIDGLSSNGDNIENVYYGGNETQWKAIALGTGNEPLTSATIHYNSTGPDDVGSDNMNPVYFLSGWNTATRTVQFGDNTLSTPITYTVADAVDVSSIDSLLNKYVLVAMEQGDSSLEYTITNIQPVESKIGIVSATGEHSLTIDGTTYPVREDYKLASHDGKEVLYHVSNGTIMGFDVLEEKTGTLEAWDAATGKATIDGKTYVTNYLSDLSLMNNTDNVIGKKIEFSVVDSIDYCLALSFSFCPGFYFSSNAPTNSIERGSTFDLYVGYYFDDGSMDSRSKDFVSVVSDNKVVEIVPDGWSDKYGQHYTAEATGVGNTTFTVTNSRNNDSASLNLYVIEKEYGYNFDNVPKLTYEEGKVTNFYNHNGLVVDEFAYTPHKNASGEIDYYVVTMNVYNTLDLYGAVTAYNADGVSTGFYLIDKKGVLPSNFTNTVRDLVKETGDLFYLIGNNSYYSGESISKKTEVTIKVQAGGYLEISNSLYSLTALCANTVGLIVEGLSTAKNVISGSEDLIKYYESIPDDEGKAAVIYEIAQAVISEDYIGKAVDKNIKSAVYDELKNANWSFSNCGECLSELLGRLSEFQINLPDTISKKIFSLTGVGSITEKIVLKVVPTGNIINFLYDVMGIGDQAAAWITFQKSADFANGIYIYTPSTGKSYSSNGISVGLV